MRGSPSSDPGPAHHAVVGRLAELRRRRGVDGAAVCGAVRDLVVVCSSSRGGSSLFGELLRRSAEVLTFSAEINPHVTIPTIPDGGCDLLADPSPVAGVGPGLRVLRDELAADLGAPARRVDLTSLVDHVAWRLTMQWPAEDIDVDGVGVWVEDTLAEVTPAGGLSHRQEFLLRLLPRVRSTHPAVNPYRYDLPDELVRRRFPDVDVPSGPTAEPVVEMAPFVLPRPWRRASMAEASTRPVVATTPRNALRLPLLAAAFPHARVRVVHLTRNPAAAVNGLMDGWLHRGFFSCRSDETLSIDGYSDRLPAWGRDWWNYDVPPGWRSWVDRPLAEVCAFQWVAAHQATLERVTAAGLDRHRIAFEDVAGPPDRRRRAMSGLCRWLGIDPAAVVADDRLPVVMPTTPPGRRRWVGRADGLSQVLRDRRVLDMARELGYAADPGGWE